MKIDEVALKILCALLYDPQRVTDYMSEKKVERTIATAYLIARRFIQYNEILESYNKNP